MILPTPGDFESQYLALMQRILNYGQKILDRTGVGTFSSFGAFLDHDMKLGFPLLRSKKVWFHGVKAELLWFLNGDTNITWLQEQGVHIWDSWANEKGDLGPVYGKQWRNCGGIDQIASLIESLKRNPHSRRHIVSAWNVGELKDMALLPCHYSFQCYVEPPLQEGGKQRLSLIWNQRSVDMFLGLPFNIASYALLLQMIAQVVDMIPTRVGCFLGDTHIYKNHVAQAQQQIVTYYKYLEQPYCTLQLNPEITDINTFTIQDIQIQYYVSGPTIKAPIAV